MRTTFRIALILALAASVTGAALPDVDFRIPAGRHEGFTLANLPALICLSTRPDRRLTFQALFTPSAAYLTRDPSNQADWCKLMGITTPLIHRNSIRLGWRWDPAAQQVELGFYGYLKGQRIEQPLAHVAVNQWIDVELRLHGGGLMARAGAARYERLQGLGLSSLFPTPTAILRTAYFGGDETAPHDIQIRVRAVNAR